VLIAGVYDPLTALFGSTAPTESGRARHSAVLLDGKILDTGGGTQGCSRKRGTLPTMS